MTLEILHHDNLSAYWLVSGTFLKSPEHSTLTTNRT